MNKEITTYILNLQEFYAESKIYKNSNYKFTLNRKEDKNFEKIPVNILIDDYHLGEQISIGATPDYIKTHLFSSIENDLIREELGMLFHEMYSTLMTFGITSKLDVGIGSIPVGNLNAAVVKINPKNSIILFHYGFFGLIKMMSVLFARIISDLPENSNKESNFRLDINVDRIKEYLSDDVITNEFYQKIIYNFKKMGSADYGVENTDIDKLVSNKFTIVIAEKVQKFMSQYVLAHELAHIILHHQENKTAQVIIDKLDSTSSKNFIHKKEFEADSFALYLSLKAANCSNSNDLFIQMCAILLFFFNKDVIEGNPQNQLSTYPSVEARVTNLKTAYERTLNYSSWNDLFYQAEYVSSNMVKFLDEINASKY